MKQLLFLLLFPCLALAQYQGNGNQKITLGEQTTADGLVYRGLASIDTVTATSKITRANKQDTSAFILLDTVTNFLWHYKTGSNAWLQAGGSTFDTTTLNLTTRFAAKQNNITLTTTGTSGAATFSPVTATLNIPNYTITNPVTGTGTTNYLPKFTGTSTIGNSLIYDNGTNVGIGTASPAYKLDVNGTGRFAGNVAINGSSIDINPSSGNPNITLRSGNTFRGYIEGNSSGGLSFGAGASASIYFTIASTGAATFSNSVTATTGIFTNYTGGGTTGASIDNTGQIVRTSSIELKKDITNLKYGLNEILQIKPINFNWKDEDKFGNENENGFIAEDVLSIIPNAVGCDAQGIFMDYNKLIPVLTKAIQEQNTLIKALEQRILILENK